MLWIIENATFVAKNRFPLFRTMHLEHVPEKWAHFSDKDMLQHVELARILFDQAIPPDRNTR